MLDHITPKIPKESKIIIGLGDSYTQGVGSWSKETYKKHKGRIDPLKTFSDELTIEMYHNSWVHQLCRNHLTDFIPVNLGIAGAGNRAAVKELYLNPNIEFDNAKEVIVIYMMSGLERFDFVTRNYTSHSHFYTMWPHPWDPNSTNKNLWQAYADSLWSEQFNVLENILNIREAEIYCQAKNWKLVVTSAFDQRITTDYFLKHAGVENKKLVDSVSWNNFLYPHGMKSFMELLLTHDGNAHMVDGEFYNHYSKLKEPTEYITNCIHPTQEGARIIAEEMFEFLKDNRLINV